MIDADDATLFEEKIQQALQKYLNECSSSPCLNGGTCINFGTNYQYDCTSGYSGQNCQTHFIACYDADKNGTSLPAIVTLRINSSAFSQTLVKANCLPGGWTVIQSRGQFNNPDDYFQKDWVDYVRGFGTPGKLCIFSSID